MSTPSSSSSSSSSSLQQENKLVAVEEGENNKTKKQPRFPRAQSAQTPQPKTKKIQDLYEKLQSLEQEQKQQQRQKQNQKKPTTLSPLNNSASAAASSSPSSNNNNNNNENSNISTASAATAGEGSDNNEQQQQTKKKKNKPRLLVPRHVAYSPLFRSLPEGAKYFEEAPFSIKELKLHRELHCEKKEIKRRLEPGQRQPVPEIRPHHIHPSRALSDNANRATALTAFGPVPSSLAMQVAAHRSHLRHRAYVESFENSETRAKQTAAAKESASAVFHAAMKTQKKREQEEAGFRRAIEQFEDRLEEQRDNFSLSELSQRSATELRERRTRKNLREALWRGRQTIIFNATVAAISLSELKGRARIQVEHFVERENLERNCLQRVILNDRVQFLATERVQRAAIMHLLQAQLAWRFRQEEELTRMISLERRSRQKVEDEEHFDYSPLETAKRALLEQRAKELKVQEELRVAKQLEMEQHHRLCRGDLERSETNARQALRSEDLDVRVQIRAQFVVAKRAVTDIEEKKRQHALEQWLAMCARQQKPVIDQENSIRTQIRSDMISQFNDIVGDFHQQWAELLVPVTADFGPTNISCCRCGPPVSFASNINFKKKPYLWYRDLYLVAVSIKVRFITNGRGTSDALSLAATQVASVAPKRSKRQQQDQQQSSQQQQQQGGGGGGGGTSAATAAAGGGSSANNNNNNNNEPPPNKIPSMATNTPGLRLLIDGNVLSEDGTILCNAKFGDEGEGGGGGSGGENEGGGCSTLDFEFQAPTDDGIVPLDHVERILKNMTVAPDVQLLSHVSRELQFTATMWFQRRLTAGTVPIKNHQVKPGSKEAYSLGSVYSISVIPPMIGCYGRAHSPQVTILFDAKKRVGVGRGYSLSLLPDPQGLKSLHTDALTSGDDTTTTTTTTTTKDNKEKEEAPTAAAASSAPSSPKKSASKSKFQQPAVAPQLFSGPGISPTAMLTAASLKIRFVTGFVQNEDAIRWSGNADGFKVRKEDVQLDSTVIAKPVKAPGFVMAYDFGLKHEAAFPLSVISRFLARLVYCNDNDQGPTSLNSRTLEISVAVKRVKEPDEDGTRNIELVSFLNVEVVMTTNHRDDTMLLCDPGKTGSAPPALIRVSREHASSAMRRYLNKVEERSAQLFPSASIELRGTNPTQVTLRASISGGATFSLDLPKPNAKGDASGGGKSSLKMNHGGGGDEFDLDEDPSGGGFEMGMDEDDEDEDDPFGDDASSVASAATPLKGSKAAAAAAEKEKEKKKKEKKVEGSLAIGAVPDDMTAPEDSTGIFWCGVETDPNVPATRACVGYISVDSGKLDAFFKQDTKPIVVSKLLQALVVSVTDTTPAMGASRAGTQAIASVQLTVTEHAPPSKRSAFSNFQPREPENALLQRVVLYVAPSITTNISRISFPKESDIPQFLTGIVVLPSAALASAACGSKLAGGTLTVSIVDGRSGFEQLIIQPHDSAETENLTSSEVVQLDTAMGEQDIKVGYRKIARVVQMETAGKPLILKMADTASEHLTSDISVPLLQIVLSRIAYMHSDADVLYEKVLMLQLTDVTGGSCYAACAVQVVPSFEPTVMDDPPERPMIYRVARYPVYADNWMPLLQYSDLSDPDTELVGDAFMNVDPVSGTTEDDEIGFSEVPDPSGKHNITFSRLSINSPLSILCNGREVALCRTVKNEGRSNALRVTFRPGIHLEVCGAVSRTLCFRRQDEEVLRTIGDSTEIKSYVFRFNAGDEEGVPDTRVDFQVRLRPPLLWRLLLHDAPLITAPRTVQPFRHVQTGAPTREVIAGDILDVFLYDGSIEGDQIEVGGSDGIHCVKDPQTQGDVVVVDLDVTRRLMTRVIGVTPGFSGIRVAEVTWEKPDHMRVLFSPKCPLPAALVSLILSSVGFKVADHPDERRCSLRSTFTHHVIVDESYTSEEKGWLDSFVIVQNNDEPTDIHLKHNIVPCFASGSCFPFAGTELTDPDTECFDEESVVSVVSGTSGVFLSVLVQSGASFVLEERPVQIEGKTPAQCKGISQFQVLLTLTKEKKPACTLRVHDMSKGATKNAVYFDMFENVSLPLVAKMMECIAAKIAPDVRPAGHLLDVHLAANPRTTATTARVQLDVMLPCCTRVDPAPLHWLVAKEETVIFPEQINITVPGTSSLEVEFRFLDSETFWTSSLLRDAQFVVAVASPLTYSGSSVTVTTPGVSTPTIVCVVDANSAKQSLRLSFPRSSSRQGQALIESVLKSISIQVPEGGTVVPAGLLKEHSKNNSNSEEPGGAIELAELRVVVSMTVPTATGPPASLALVKLVKRVVMPNTK